MLGATRRWLESKPPNSNTTWEFYPSKKTTKLRGEITNIAQKHGKNMYQAWAHFKQMLNALLYHMQTNEVLAHTFFGGLKYNAHSPLNSAVGGQALSITSETFFDSLDKLSKGNQGYKGEISRTTQGS